MEDLKQVLNESLNESYNTMTSNTQQDLLAGVDYDGNAGVIIGGVFRAGDKGWRRKVESFVKKTGYAIGYTIEDGLGDDTFTEDDNVCYFLDNDTNNSYANCYKVGSEGVEPLSTIR